MDEVNVEIVPDPGPAAMAAGLRAAAARAAERGQRLVGVVMCHRHQGWLWMEFQDLAPGDALYDLPIYYSCDTRTDAPSCSCERAKGPALAVEGAMEVPIVGAVSEVGRLASCAERPPRVVANVSIDVAQTERMLREMVRDKVHVETDPLLALLHQGAQLVADGEPSELSRQWLELVRAALREGR